MRKLVYFVLLVAGVILLYWLAPFANKESGAQSAQENTATSGQRVVTNDAIAFDISVHSLSELTDILQRAEKLASQPRPANQTASISVLLHGPEISFFQIDRYSQHRDLVDLAARLDAYKIVELKMCETAMRSYGVDKTNIPGFIEFVPDADIELKQLKRRGYAIL